MKMVILRCICRGLLDGESDGVGCGSRTRGTGNGDGVNSGGSAGIACATTAADATNTASSSASQYTSVEGDQQHQRADDSLPPTAPHRDAKEKDAGQGCSARCVPANSWTRRISQRTTSGRSGGHSQSGGGRVSAYQ